MSALLHFDTEFTHPVPRLGALLQIGMAVHPFDEESLKCSGPIEYLQATFKLPEGAMVTDWVQQNQAELLERCADLSFEDDTLARQSVLDFLVAAKEKFGKLIPAGYVLGSDIAYLYDLLGRDHELVHYAAIDFKSVALCLTGAFEDGDDVIAEEFDIAPNEEEHDALSDTVYQAKLLINSLRFIGSQPKPLAPAGA